MSEPPTRNGVPRVYPRYTGVETPDVAVVDRSIAATFSGVMNPSLPRRVAAEAVSSATGMKRGPFNIDRRYIGYTTGFTTLCRGAVFSGVPRVHWGFTRYIGGYTGGPEVIPRPMTPTERTRLAEAAGTPSEAVSTSQLIDRRTPEIYTMNAENTDIRGLTPRVNA